MTTTYTHLFPRPTYTWAITSTGNIFVFSAVSGILLFTSQDASIPTTVHEKVFKAGAVTGADASRDGKVFVTVGSDKCVRTWSVGEKGLEALSEREAPKKPTCVRLTNDGGTILVSDKFGDVHSFPLIPFDDQQKKSSTSEILSPSSSKQKQKTPARSHPTLLLGHVSLLTTFLLTPDSRYIITADRDEHVRVSWYPEAYVIERMCCGHTRFVSALHLLPSSPSRLLSGGGDPVIKVWDWLEGRVIQDIFIEDAVKPFIKVLRRGVSDGEGDGDESGRETGEKQGGKKISAKQRRRANRKAKGAAQADGESDSGVLVIHEGDGEEEEGAGDESKTKEDAMDVDSPTTNDQTDESALPSTAHHFTKKDESPALEPLLALHKIESVTSSGSSASSQWIVFSAIGATALFAFAYPACISSAQTTCHNSETESETHPRITIVDFDAPILEFVRITPASSTLVAENNARDGDEVWVLLDLAWRKNDNSAKERESEKVDVVRVVKIIDGELVMQSGSSIYPDLLNALNSVSIPPALIPSPPQAATDLYTLLSILPKPAHTQNAKTTSNVDVDAQSTLNGPGVDVKQLSAKERGRLKSKLAVMKKRAEMEGTGGGGERESKKVKTDEEGDIRDE